MSKKKADSSLYDMRQMGALVVSVLIEFESNDDADNFTHPKFDKGEYLKTYPAVGGTLHLEALEDLEKSDKIVGISPNSIIQIPTDKSLPQ